VEPEAQEHANRVLEKNAKKVCKDAFSNARLLVVNTYMKRRGILSTTFNNIQMST
jgi:uncharacterized protein YkuJ